MATFILYRYQFAPIKDRGHSLTGTMNVDLSDMELMAKKQQIFKEILRIETSNFFRNRRKQRFEHKIIFNQQDFCVFRLANTRKTKLEDHFVKKEHTYSPSCLVIIDNRTDCQFIAIEKSNAFEDTDSVQKILQDTFGEILANEGLCINIQKMYDTKDFWYVVDANVGKINKIRFDFSYPNLPTLNRNVKEMIKSIAENTHSSKSALELESEKGKALNISHQDKDIISLAEMGADSGDEIKMGLVGSRSLIPIGKTVRTMILDDINFALFGDLFHKGYEKLCEAFNKYIR